MHLGHIQGGILTDTLRTLFQNKFGNAGRGLVFPYNLIGTNGSTDFKSYSSSRLSHESLLHNTNKEFSSIGISGYSIGSKDSSAQLYLNPKFEYDSVRFYGLGHFAHSNVHIIPIQTFRTIRVKILKKENLTRISKRLKINKNELTRLNPKLNKIKFKPGKTISIKVKEYGFKPINGKQNDTLIQLLIKKNNLLHGIEFINNTPGIRVSGIGVNGARLKLFNFHDTFFKELKKINPDLIILAFGTNESYSGVSAIEFCLQISEFINKINNGTYKTSIIVASPPLSLLKKGQPNTYIAEYNQCIKKDCNRNQYAVFPLYDLLENIGGIKALKQQKLISGDNVHYTRKGYAWIAQQLYSSLMKYHK